MKTVTKKQKLARLNKWAEYLESSDAPISEKPIEEFKEFFNESEGCYETQIEYALFCLKGLHEQFPEYFTINKYGNPVLRFEQGLTPLYSCIKFFDLKDAALHLLVPGAQETEKYGGKILTKDVQSKDIAFNIRELISRL